MILVHACINAPPETAAANRLPSSRRKVLCCVSCLSCCWPPAHRSVAPHDARIEHWENTSAAVAYVAAVWRTFFACLVCLSRPRAVCCVAAAPSVKSTNTFLATSIVQLWWPSSGDIKGGAYRVSHPPSWSCITAQSAFTSLLVVQHQRLKR